jgi:hypothetical protein
LLKKHEILNQIDMKREVFLKDYVCSPTGLNMKEEEYKNKHKADVYYFNVDLKFIIKARLHRVRKEFEDHMKGNLKHGQKWMCKSCEFGEQRVYDEVTASSLRFKCDHCSRQLVEVVDENKLTEDEQVKCRRAIEDLKRKLS